jgi:hypothetical protein
MSRGWNYTPGDWWAICDSCGRKFKASQLKERWDGFMVCKEDWEPRHEQDFVQARADHISVPWARHPSATFIVVDYLPYWDSGYAFDGYVIGDYI